MKARLIPSVLRQLGCRPFVGICAFIAIAASACSRAADPTDTIRHAYQWYVDTVKAGKNPFEESESDLRPLVTERFLGSMQYLRSDLENSPFVDADGFDARLGIENTSTRGETAVTRVVLAGRVIGKHTLNVYLLKQERVWKIDDVKYVE